MRVRVVVAVPSPAAGGQFQSQIQLVRLVQRVTLVDIQTDVFLEDRKPLVGVKHFDRHLLKLVVNGAVC